MLQVIHPPPHLAHWIDGGVIARLDARAGASQFPAVPHGMLTMQLAAASRAERHPVKWLQPPVAFHTLSTAPVSHVHTGDITAIGILVRPAAAAGLLRQLGPAVINQVLPWETLAGSQEADRLESTVALAHTDEERLAALMASFSRTMARATRERDHSSDVLLSALVGAHGAGAAVHLGLGRRQIERRCRAALGVSPKQFQRLTRFHNALSIAVSTARPTPTAEVAVAVGFYDQSHMARDARDLAGAPMSMLISAARPDTPWWPLAARRAFG